MSRVTIRIISQSWLERNLENYMPIEKKTEAHDMQQLMTYVYFDLNKTQFRRYHLVKVASLSLLSECFRPPSVRGISLQGLLASISIPKRLQKTQIPLLRLETFL